MADAMTAAEALGQNGHQPDDGGGDNPPPGQGNEPPPNVNDGIAGMSAMRGLMMYGAVLAFAGLYIDFIVIISSAKTKPTIPPALIAAAAALSGVLGSAFALKIGVAHSPAALNKELAKHVKRARGGKPYTVAGMLIRQALSLEPSDANGKSWPLTFGIWAYAIVASSVLAAFALNLDQTPDGVKALAITFGGYVIALINVAYGMQKQANG
ncbi:MAG TPA: hypothetical protein VG186_01150 [Solirubrobacteraceae bacterium]|nr:hypothetical protein [Solirubrobacteraceae bacterium]